MRLPSLFSRSPMDKTMKRIAIIWLAVVVLVTAVLGQDARPPDTGGKPSVAQSKGAPPSVDKILDKRSRGLRRA